MISASIFAHVVAILCHVQLKCLIYCPQIKIYRCSGSNVATVNGHDSNGHDDREIQEDIRKRKTHRHFLRDFSAAKGFSPLMNVPKEHFESTCTYSRTCLERPPHWPQKCGLSREVSVDRFSYIEMYILLPKMYGLSRPAVYYGSGLSRQVSLYQYYLS